MTDEELLKLYNTALNNDGFGLAPASARRALFEAGSVAAEARLRAAVAEARQAGYDAGLAESRKSASPITPEVGEILLNLSRIQISSTPTALHFIGDALAILLKSTLSTEAPEPAPPELSRKYIINEFSPFFRRHDGDYVTQLTHHPELGSITSHPDCCYDWVVPGNRGSTRSLDSAETAMLEALRSKGTVLNWFEVVTGNFRLTHDGGSFGTTDIARIWSIYNRLHWGLTDSFLGENANEYVTTEPIDGVGPSPEQFSRAKTSIASQLRERGLLL